jgi:hypothetical protein
MPQLRHPDQQLQRLGIIQSAKACSAAGKYSRSVERSRSTCQVQSQIRDWWVRSVSLIASPSTGSPATGGWWVRSRRTVSASRFASAASDFAPDVECRSR